MPLDSAKHAIIRHLEHLCKQELEHMTTGELNELMATQAVLRVLDKMYLDLTNQRLIDKILT